MVLRATDQRAGSLDIHTDLRSVKVTDLRATPFAALHVWDAAGHLQIRLPCTAFTDDLKPRVAVAFSRDPEIGSGDGLRQMQQFHVATKIQQHPDLCGLGSLDHLKDQPAVCRMAAQNLEGANVACNLCPRPVTHFSAAPLCPAEQIQQGRAFRRQDAGGEGSRD